MASLGPGDAIRLLQRTIALPGVSVTRAYFAHDLANLRRAHTDDAAFASAVLAVAKEISLALKSPATHGVGARFEIAGWRRSKFSSYPGGRDNLRLVFRAHKMGGVEIITFGDRQLPQSVYRTAKERL